MEIYNMFLVLNLENILIIPSNFSFLDLLLAGDKKNNCLSPLSIGQGQGLCDQDGILFILRTFHHQKYI